MRGYKFLLQGCRGKQILLHCALAMFSPTSGEATFLPLGFFWTSNSFPDDLFITLNQGCTINRGENSWIRIQDNNYAKKKLRKPIKKKPLLLVNTPHSWRDWNKWWSIFRKICPRFPHSWCPTSTRYQDGG